MRTTHLRRILDGFGDYLIYAYEDADKAGSLGAWFIGDLDVFRMWFRNESERLADYAKVGATKPWPWGWGYETPNRDGTAFMPFTIGVLPDEFVVAHHLPHLIGRLHDMRVPPGLAVR